jgi:hypothetical protein
MYDHCRLLVVAALSSEAARCLLRSTCFKRLEKGAVAKPLHGRARVGKVQFSSVPWVRLQARTLWSVGAVVAQTSTLWGPSKVGFYYSVGSCAGWSLID